MNMASAPVDNEPSLKASDVKLCQLMFGIDKSLTIVDEDPCSLNYITPSFRAAASVEIPILPAGANIEIGWIQVCTDLDLIFIYDDQGISSWEIPELVSGKYTMVSDSDGKQYPWYLATSEIAFIQGPTNDKICIAVFMEDYLTSKVSFLAPGGGFPKEPRLSFVYRKQKFYSYLTLKDINTNTYHVLKTLAWSMELAIDVNLNNPMGMRCQLLGPFENECPIVVPAHLNPPLQCYALKPPCCNDIQALMWRPYDGDAEVIKPPAMSTLDVYNYALHSDVHTKRLMLITKENFLKGKL